MYKVIEPFVDLQDELYAYGVGDTFPRKGLKVSEDRFKELSGSNNKRNMPLIKEVKKAKKKEK